MTLTYPLASVAVLALSLAAPLAATAQTAPEIAPEAALRVIGFFRSYGCALNAEQVDLFAAEMDVTQEDYTAILTDLIDRGFATGDATVTGEVALTPEFCGPQHADPAEVLVTVMRWNGCSLTGQEAPQFLLPMGFMPPDVANLVAQLRDQDRLLVEPSLLTLTEEACAAPAE